MASYKIESTTSCVNEIKCKIKDNIVKSLEFTGGCSIICQAISKLAAERNIDELIELLSDIKEPCINKETCISQVVELLKTSKEKEIQKEYEEAQYRISPDGILNNINTLLSKTKLNTEKDGIAIKVKTKLYDIIVENVNKIKDQLEVEVYVDKFDDFIGDYIFSTVGKRSNQE